MAASTPSDSLGKGRLWAGRILSAVPVLGLFVSAGMKLSHRPEVVQMFVGKFGYPESALLGIGLLELTCVVLYLVPWTSVLGAVLLTGYLGGAIATHVRVSDPFIAPLALGVLVWLGLYLRDRRLAALMPGRARRP